MNNVYQFKEWVLTKGGLFSIIYSLGIIFLAYKTGLLEVWTTSEEYGHGAMALCVLIYVIYRRWDDNNVGKPSNIVLVMSLMTLAALLSVGSVVSGISIIGYYGIWLFIVSAVSAIGGIKLLRYLMVPLLIIVLLFPLPNPIGPMLTSELQLVSSNLGVWFIRAFGGSVYQEGNVLDMGSTQLLVAEACAGLRYLFPLMSIGALIGYMLLISLWIRWAIFLVTIPITIFLNSLRIAITGILVESTGLSHTEGFLHFFEGWVVFVFALILLITISFLLVSVFHPGVSFFKMLDLPDQQNLKLTDFSISHYAPLGIVGMIFIVLVFSYYLDDVDSVKLTRTELNEFPSRIGDWNASVSRLSSIVEEVAGASEYFLGDFTDKNGNKVNVYISYYKTQRDGQVPHSPKVCLPGGGWVIQSQDLVSVKG